MCVESTIADHGDLLCYRFRGRARLIYLLGKLLREENQPTPTRVTSQWFPKQFFSEHAVPLIWAFRNSQLAKGNPQGLWNSARCKLVRWQTMLRAYFDESEREGGTFCVAGYAFAPQQAKKFSKEWSRLFADYPGGMHMRDLTHRRGHLQESLQQNSTASLSRRPRLSIDA